MPLAILAAIACVVWLVPESAAAHPMPGVGDFYAGMLHPITTIEFLLPLVAIGLLAGQQTRDLALRMLLATPVALLIGAVIGMSWPLPHAVSLITVGSMAVLGMLVAAAPSLPAVLGLALAVIPGVAIGWANGVELGDQISPLRFLPGVVVSGAMLVVYSIGCVRGFRASWTRVAFRVLGSWIAAVGILVLGVG